MIAIYMFDDTWRIVIGDEIWEFNSLEEMQEVLNSMLEFKDQYGRRFSKE